MSILSFGENEVGDLVSLCETSVCNFPTILYVKVLPEAFADPVRALLLVGGRSMYFIFFAASSFLVTSSSISFSTTIPHNTLITSS